jgi:hypothetical protein
MLGWKNKLAQEINICIGQNNQQVQAVLQALINSTLTNNMDFQLFAN